MECCIFVIVGLYFTSLFGIIFFYMEYVLYFILLAFLFHLFSYLMSECKVREEEREGKVA